MSVRGPLGSADYEGPLFLLFFFPIKAFWSADHKDPFLITYSICFKGTQKLTFGKLRFTETQLANLGIKYVAIRSSDTQEERTEKINEFNNLDNDTMVLLVTNALGSVSINLQQGSACVIVLEIPIAFYILIQIMGRVNRIGQKERQRLIILWNHHSYDQMCLNRIAKKIVPSLAGEGAAAQCPDPEVAAETLLQEFLGMPFYHRPFAECWGLTPYKAIDNHARDLQIMGREEVISRVRRDIDPIREGTHYIPPNLWKESDDPEPASPFKGKFTFPPRVQVSWR